MLHDGLGGNDDRIFGHVGIDAVAGKPTDRQINRFGARQDVAFPKPNLSGCKTGIIMQRQGVIWAWELLIEAESMASAPPPRSSAGWPIITKVPFQLFFIWLSSLAVPTKQVM